MQNLNIKIGGREFQIGCEPEEHSNLCAAADLLNSEIASMQDGPGNMNVSLETSAVMSALNFAAELIRLRSDAQSQQNSPNERDGQRITELIEKIDSALMD